jgi:hypothetical protein
VASESTRREARTLLGALCGWMYCTVVVPVAVGAGVLVALVVLVDFAALVGEAPTAWKSAARTRVEVIMMRAMSVGLCGWCSLAYPAGPLYIAPGALAPQVACAVEAGT